MCKRITTVAVLFILWILLSALVVTHMDRDNWVTALFALSVFMLSLFGYNYFMRSLDERILSTNNNVMVLEKEIEYERPGNCSKCNQPINWRNSIFIATCEHEFHEDCYIEFNERSNLGKDFCPTCLEYIEQYTLYQYNGVVPEDANDNLATINLDDVPMEFNDLHVFS